MLQGGAVGVMHCVYHRELLCVLRGVLQGVFKCVLQCVVQGVLQGALQSDAV